MADEKKDMYIAAAVGGVALVLIYLYLYSGSTPTQTNADGTSLPSTTETPAPGLNSYNYNIAPYNPQPGLQLAAQPLTTGIGGGCCDTCGPSSGGSFQNVTAAQFNTLIGYGTQAGANG